MRPQPPNQEVLLAGPQATVKSTPVARARAPERFMGPDDLLRASEGFRASRFGIFSRASVVQRSAA